MGKHRYPRLTGSNFGLVLAAYERHVLNSKPYPPSLFKTLKGQYSLAGKDAIMWGQMQGEAVQAYMELTGNTVKSVGLVLLPYGFLGCSPDVLFIQRTKHLNHTIAEIIEKEVGNKTSNNFYLNSDGTINERHNYWHQVQGEMTAANVTWAHFVIWTTKELKYISVCQNISWAETNISKLKDFYINEFLPTCI